MNASAAAPQSPQKPVILTNETGYDFTTMQRDLDKAKSALFMSRDAAFFGPLMCSLEFVWSKDMPYPTAATDGTHLWWHPDDFLRSEVEERKATIMHELWHVARLHGVRRGNRCPDVWNQACDIRINRDLVEQGYTFIATSPNWLHRPDITEELEEEIYEILNKQGGAGAPPPGNPKGGPGNQPAPGSNHQCMHGQIELTSQDKQRMINATVKAIQSAQHSKQAGAIPGGLELMVEKFLKPKVPWEAVLYNFFNDLGDEDYTWARPDRRTLPTGIYLPTTESEDRLEHLMYFLDVSGSVSDQDVVRFNSEVKFIKDTFNPVKLTLVQFDTIIQKVDVFTEDEPFEKIVVVGRGGTSLVPVRQMIIDQRPTAAIIFSDLFCTPMEPEGVDCPVIWIAVGNESAEVPFGKLIHITS